MTQLNPKLIFIIIVFTVPLIVAGLHRFYIALIQGTKLHWFHNERMPRVLRSAQLVLNESLVSTQQPFPLHGQVDQAFRTKRGQLVLVDTKTRREPVVHHDDITQLSLYAFILRTQGEKRLAPYGYIRTVTSSHPDSKSVYYHKVPILSSRQVLRFLGK